MFYSLDAFYYFYPEDTPLRRLLYRHSCQVMEKSMQILDIRKVKLDCALVEAGALLHDMRQESSAQETSHTWHTESSAAK